MFPEPVICAPASLTNVLARAPQGNGVHLLLFAWRQLLFKFEGAATLNPVLGKLLEKLMEAHTTTKQDVCVEPFVQNSAHRLKSIVSRLDTNVVFSCFMRVHQLC